MACLPMNRNDLYPHDRLDLDTQTGEELRRQNEINDWLPITSSRNAKWWHVVAYNITAVVGAGVLGLPYAMANLGWGPGVTAMVLSWIITLYTLWQMVKMHEMIPYRRFDRYHELGQHAFGKNLGLWIVVPQQLIVEVGLCIVYLVTGGQSLQNIHEKVCASCRSMRTTYFIMIFSSVHFVLSHLPNFNSITSISIVAAVMSVSYSTMVWAASINKELHQEVSYSLHAKTPAGQVFGFFNALGTIAFAYAGHNVVLEIQATIPSTADKTSEGPMLKGVTVTYIVLALCYFPVALIGYKRFGNDVDDNILNTLIKLHMPVWFIAMVNLFVVIHLIGSYQIFAMPIFDMLENALIKKMKFKPSRKLRFITRNSYVAFTMFIAITFPFFRGLLGFFGGFGFAPTTYMLPCIIWLAVYKPRRFSASWITNWICIVLGILLMIMSAIGGLREIIIQAKGYHFYS